VLHIIKDLEGFTIGAIDGMIGHVKDFYFDDQSWVIRYLVVETGSWLSNRRVLVSPFAINQPNWSEKIFPAAITREQVRNSPSIDTDKPVSRQHEIEYLNYYKYPHYWGGGDFWGDGMMWLGMGSGQTPGLSRSNEAELTKADGDGDSAGRRRDPHLRSRNEMTGYDVFATDGHIGHVQGFLLDEKGWAIRFIVVNTSNWWMGHHVVVAPQWITDLGWEKRRVSVNLTRSAVKDSPPYSPRVRMERDEAARIFDYHHRPGFWAHEIQMQNPEFREVNRA
jgi:uncharacterized protein YrrD